MIECFEVELNFGRSWDVITIAGETRHPSIEGARDAIRNDSINYEIDTEYYRIVKVTREVVE